MIGHLILPILFSFFFLRPNQESNLKHNHDADVNINVNIPKQDLEDLIDKATTAGITLIVVFTAAQIVKTLINPRST